ncbi:odorant receptor 7a-like [Cochliomyia hominivorax]
MFSLLETINMFARLWSRGTNSSASREATAYLFQMFWYLGQGTTKEWSTLYYFYFVLMHAFICIFLPITFTLSYIYEYDKITTVQLLTSLQAFFNVWGIPAKVLTMFMLMKRLRQSLLLMDILDARCQLPEEYEKLKECAVVGNRLTVFYVTFYSLYVVATLTTSVIMGKPPYSLFIPLMDWRNSRREFVAQAVIEFIIVNVACLHQAVDDVYAVIYVYVIRKHLHILVERVKRLGLTSHQQNLPLKDADYYQQLVLCVKDHQLLLSFRLRFISLLRNMVNMTTTTGNQDMLLKNTTKGKPPKKVATKEALTYLFRCFRILGLYRTEKYKYVYMIYCIFIHLSVTLFLPTSFIASYSLESNKNLDYDTLFTSIQVAINVFGCSLKICMLLYYIPHLLTAEPIMAKLDESCVAHDEVELLYKIKNLGRKLVVNFSITFWSYSISTFVVSMMAAHPPYSLYLPYINWRNSRWEFFIASFIEFLLMDAACFQQVANDSYAAVYVCILRAHVNILRLRIRKLGSDVSKSLEENENELKMCIKDHKNLIDLYKIIYPVISATIFLQFTNTAGILGITLINILIFAKGYSSIIASCFYVLAVVVEIFPLCYYANCLMYDSDLLSVEIFHSNWMKQNTRYRKMLIFFIQRSQQTMELMAGKMFPINLNSFISIAKFSFSLYTLIKKMGIKERLGLQ